MSMTAARSVATAASSAAARKRCCANAVVMLGWTLEVVTLGRALEVPAIARGCRARARAENYLPRRAVGDDVAGLSGLRMKSLRDRARRFTPDETDQKDAKQTNRYSPLALGGSSSRPMVTRQVLVQPGGDALRKKS